MTDIAPNLKLPPTIGPGGSFVTLEQDTPDEIVQCATAVVSTIVGTRIGNPDFGVPDQSFREGGPSVEQIRTALDMWEPRANAVVDVALNTQDMRTYTVDVGVATSGEDNG